jgi:tRNA threonylcarbamoyladenosine biosynthesis protein TsaE
MDSQEPVTCRLELTSQNALDTQRIGKSLGELLRGGELILLDGQLGAGKTTFTQGLARGMSISAVVNSPTFTLLKEYKREQSGQASSPASDTQALYHFDLYRLDEPEEMIDLGFEEYFYGSGVCVVEWADKATDFWPTERLYIHLTTLDEVERDLERNVFKRDLKRNLLFIATGSRYCELLREFQKKIYAAISS